MPRFISDKIQINKANVKQTTFEGKSYIVAPVVILTEGVHVGSAGRVLYTKEELKRNAQTWAGRPLPVNHPVEGGNNVSCNDPGVIEKVSVGQIFNTKFEDNPPRILGELWIDLEKCNKVDQRVLQELSEGRLEVSTGMWFELEAKSGVWGTEEYDFIASNFQPDHVALLPGGRGACSFDDGCGAPRTNEQKKTLWDHIKDWFLGPARPSAVFNEASYSQIAARLQNALDGLADPQNNVFVWLEDVYDKYLVYAYAVDGEQTKYYTVTYTVDNDDNVSIAEQETKKEVIKKISWKTANGAVLNTETENMEEEDVERKKLIAGLIACANCVFTEEDRPYLEGLSDEKLAKIEEQRVKINSINSPETAKEPAANTAPVVNNINDWLKQVPQEMADLVRSSLSAANSRKDYLVKQIGENPRNTFTTEELAGMRVNQLESLAKLAHIPVDYSLMSGPPKVNRQDFAVLEDPEPLFPVAK